MDLAIENGDVPSGKLTNVDPENSLFFKGFTNLPTPMTARVELLIYQKVYSFFMEISIWGFERLMCTGDIQHQRRSAYIYIYIQG